MARQAKHEYNWRLHDATPDLHCRDHAPLCKLATLLLAQLPVMRLSCRHSICNSSHIRNKNVVVQRPLISLTVLPQVL